LTSCIINSLSGKLSSFLAVTWVGTKIKVNWKV